MFDVHDLENALMAFEASDESVESQHTEVIYEAIKVAREVLLTASGEINYKNRSDLWEAYHRKVRSEPRLNGVMEFAGGRHAVIQTTKGELLLPL